LPADLVTAAFFVVTLLLGLFIVVAISMLIYISTFITMSAAGSLLMFGVIGEFLAGMIIPIPLMPDWLQAIVNYLPFRFTADFPFRVYSGHISISEALELLPLQLAWLAALIVVGKFAMGKALRRVVVQGG
jgi:ABC-2 type transport system permease protein